ncbi:MAG: hypothetical protein WCK34_09190 [Bacteroidota bacterium]
MHDLGIQYFFDSISRFQPDESTLVTRLEYSLTGHLVFSAFSQFTTRIFNTYSYETDQAGISFKMHNESFLTPLRWTFSAGFGWTYPRFATITIGLASGKFTYIRDKGIFDQRKVTVFYGIPKGKNHLIEYGLSFHLLIDRNFKDRVRWNCDMMMFKNYNKPVDLVMKNLIGIRINKYFKTGVQTNVSYESAASRALQVENIISLGFTINL